MKVLKFGGKSLTPGAPLNTVVDIITKEQDSEAKIIVVSAMGDTTDCLLELYNRSVCGELDEAGILDMENRCNLLGLNGDFQSELDELKELLKSNAVLKQDTNQIRDRILSFGEIQSARVLSKLLNQKGQKTRFADAREFIKVKQRGKEVEVDMEKSGNLTRAWSRTLGEGEIAVVTGFIASDDAGNTVTLGRNGTNYSASLLANFLDATEIQNWTNVSGIYSANPKYVPRAKKIKHLSYKEANELANFGANVLHGKTILPLISKSIPLKIKNSFKPEEEGTLIDPDGSNKGIKAVSVIENVSLIKISGNGLPGKVGIDARIFTALSRSDISVRIISQASSERGIGFVVDREYAASAQIVLEAEFEKEISNNEISDIRIDNDMAVLAIIGRHNYALEKAIAGLRRNKIWMHLISNSISGEHISLVVDKKNIKKAVNVVYGQVFGVTKRINLFVFGKGVVGGRLLDQIIETNEETIERRNLAIHVVGIAHSKKMLLQENGITGDWRNQLNHATTESDIDKALQWLTDSGLENIVVADNTSSAEVANRYADFVQKGFDVVASNKKFNSGSMSSYRNFRELLQRKGKHFLYETNVGAGLPLIDTLRNLYNSADRVKRVRGVFSGSLSYLFNTFSEEDRTFSEILLEAKDKGFTEPDPREDLSGLDVARKLIILAREIGMEVELDDLVVQSLIPDGMKGAESFEDFMQDKERLDTHFDLIRAELNPNEVLRYTGELDNESGKLVVSLVTVTRDLPLGNIKGTDAIFEIFTEGYGNQPIVIQGAGAGADVTARGVYSDLLRIGTQLA